MLLSIDSTEYGSNKMADPEVTSGMEETFEAAIGHPQDMASTRGIPNPS